MTSRHQSTTTPSNTTMFNPATPGLGHHRTFFDIRPRHSVLPGEYPDVEDDRDDPLSELVKQTWNLWAVSPLFGLDCNDEVKLKQYAKRLREDLASSIQQENVSYKAKFTALEELVNHPSDPPALKVVVNSKVDGKDVVNCIYQGIFLSWGERREPEADNVKLPMLLTRGTPTVTNTVHSILSQTFDCLITAMPVGQEDLMWLSAIILNSSEKSDSRKSRAMIRELILEYQIPGLPSTDLIKVKLPLDSMIFLWSKICPTHPSSTNPNEQVASVIKLEQVKKLFECIRIQMLDNANLELGLCLLDKISLPNLTIKSNKMKATDIVTMDRVLWFFQEKALLYSPTLVSAANNEEN